MPADIAQIVFLAIAAVMWIVWLTGTRFALSRVRPSRPEPGDAPGLGPDPQDVVTGEALVEGDAEAISKKIAELLITGASVGGESALKIKRRTSERIVFTTEPGLGALRHGGGPGPAFTAVDSGIIMLDTQGDRVRLRYAVSTKRFARTMRIATYAVCFGYGGLAIVLVPLLVWVFVVRSEDEAVRWQVFQTFQMVHGVWPPFLVGALGGKLRRAAVAFFDALLANVAHVA